MLEPEPTSIPTPPRDDLAGMVLMWLAFGWLALFTVVGYPIVWGAEELFIALGMPWSRVASVGLAAGLAVLVALPLFPLAWLWNRPRYRAVFQTWAWGAGWLLLMVPLRAISPFASTTATVVQLGLALLFITIAAFVLRGRRWGGSAWPALLLAPFTLYAWFALHALGSPLDILLNGVAALLLGVAASLVLHGVLLPALSETSGGRGWDMALGGFALGGLLLMMSIGFGVGGVPVLLMFVLPAAGWAALAVALWGRDLPAGNPVGTALFVALVASGPLLFMDPEEMTLVLNSSAGEIAQWGFYAAAMAALAGWLLGLLLFLFRNRLGALNPTIGWGGAAGLWLVALALYGLVGQPGFHGERLFIILKEQADLSAAPEIADRDERTTFVFETLTHHADRTQADLRVALDQFGIPYQPYYLVNAIEIEGGALHRLWLMSRPDVDRVLVSPHLRPLPEEPESATGTEEAPTEPQWNLTLIGADRVWEEFGVTGEGIIVGESDSGVQPDHPELADSYRGRESGHDYNWFDPWYQTDAPYDGGGHGTHTLGSVLGNTVGVAPGAEWFACSNLGRNLANPALYLDCMQFMLAPFPIGGDSFADGDPTRAAHVLNNSWGCPWQEGCDATSLQPAVAALRAAGIFVVASAGNEGSGGCSTVNDPIALYDEAFSVGAVDSGRELTEFSSRGPVAADGSGRIKPDIVAPGAGVLSAFPNNSYATNDGTSMAGPHVAGVVALIWSANPDLIGDIETTEQILIDSAQRARIPADFPSCGDDDALPNNLVGYGLVDAYASVKMALER